ncbi:PH domain-containing protein [Isoptericola sp. b441]|uniref:PH domain-containing protein n=1 Tax=Actinotalea lenta TaxID=3064654 RepID=A0ABT9DCF5_9CELL|nr:MULTISPECIES: PH domain-containing protein [unclassified Isoptericola]MDO8106873.1 PH domain-containing protein [Isoptericola sp. b441]MDO8121417.1 PH domain-containing protein [Isoptericola sp. b490]
MSSLDGEHAARTSRAEFRAPLGRTATTVAIVLLLGLVLAQGAQYGVVAALRALPVAAALAGAVDLVMRAPRLVVDDDGLTVVNPTQRFHVPWPALVALQTRFTLTLVTPHVKVPVWAAPGPERHAGAFAARSDIDVVASSRRGPGGTVRVSELASTASGAAAHEVHARWSRLAERGLLELGAADSTPVQRTWRPYPVGIIALLAVGGVALVALS